MPDTIITDNVVDEVVVDAQSTEEVVFDTLPDNVKRFIDQERTKASKTSREKAMRDALNDPDVVTAIKTKIETEANLSAEERLSQRAKDIALKESRVEARELLVKNGIVNKDEIEGVLSLIVSDNLGDTLTRANTFVTLFNATVASETERKTKGILKDTPKPQNSPTSTKSFKDMGFDERMQLKSKDPAKFEAEMAKVRSTI